MFQLRLRLNYCILWWFFCDISILTSLSDKNFQFFLYNCDTSRTVYVVVLCVCVCTTIETRDSSSLTTISSFHRKITSRRYFPQCRTFRCVYRLRVVSPPAQIIHEALLVYHYIPVCCVSTQKMIVFLFFFHIRDSTMDTIRESCLVSYYYYYFFVFYCITFCTYHTRYSTITTHSVL